MTARDIYNRDLRKAVAAALEGQVQASLAGIERAIAGSFAHDLPSRPTLAKAVVALGWIKLQRPGSGAIYRAADR